MNFTKDPDAELDYAVDWTDWLGTDTIVGSTWTVAAGSGIQVSNESVDPGGHVCTAWLSGGTISTAPYRVTNEITTAAGRVDDRSLLIKIQNR